MPNGEAPPGLFKDDVIEIIAAYIRGNRCNVMNMATIALEEAYYREEKTVSAETIYNADWFNDFE